MAEEWVEALNERVQFVHVAVDHEAAGGGGAATGTAGGCDGGHARG